jgi:murein DD-endopeptidase MepM/ murein hydrolase activator NlpD
MRVLVLLPALVALSTLPIGPAVADSAPRALSDDPYIDQFLAPRGPTPKSEMRTASLGPAMRRLRTTFEPVWPTIGIISTYFGETGPLSPRGHAGVDIAAKYGTPILATDDGEVVKADFDHPSYGGLVIVHHVSGYETWYGHLGRVGVEVGVRVKRGEDIGRMGSTGYSTGPHLHFEVRRDGEVVDPLQWLKESALQPPAD